MEQLKNIGEFGFIGRFAPKFEHLVKQEDSGIGDDCALLSINEDQYLLVSTDLLIEDIHFLKEEITAFELGHKALAVNLSDIAAMGGKALYSFLSIGIPQDTPVNYLDAFMEGYHSLSEKYKVALMGGDTTRSTDKLCINVVVIGESLKPKTKCRTMAEDNDIIAVTGHLGDSAGGLRALLEKCDKNNDIKKLIAKHHLPEPRLNEGMWLAQQVGVNAMMDISDGIASDLKHILKASSKGANVDLDKLPISETLASVAHNKDWDINALASSGGEDYELLLTVKPKEFLKIQQEYQQEFSKALFPIGEINTSGHLRLGGKEISKDGGFDHFL